MHIMKPQILNWVSILLVLTLAALAVFITHAILVHQLSEPQEASAKAKASESEDDKVINRLKVSRNEHGKLELAVRIRERIPANQGYGWLVTPNLRYLFTRSYAEDPEEEITFWVRSADGDRAIKKTFKVTEVFFDESDDLIVTMELDSVLPAGFDAESSKFHSVDIEKVSTWKIVGNDDGA